jgi:hypothetical protein
VRISHPLILSAILVSAIALSSCPSDGASDSSDAAISSFSFANLDAAWTVDEAAGKVAVSVRWNANLASLTPAIVHTGASISPASGVAQDFTSPVTYTVTAEDGTKKAYAVTVTHKEYAVGDTGPAGGVIVLNYEDYIGGSATTWKYLEAAPRSTEVSREWGCYGADVSGAGGSAISEGSYNTPNIVAALKARGETTKAAQYCDALTCGGYDDWFLPTEFELGTMNSVVGLADAGNEYWTSHQLPGSSNQAETYTAGSGSFKLKDKNTSHIVRAMRCF